MNTDFSLLLVVPERAHVDGIIYNKYLFFFFTLCLLPVYVEGCLFYGTRFLYFLSKQVVCFFFLTGYFFTIILPLSLFGLFPDINPYTLFSFVYESMLNIYFSFSIILFYFHGSTLMHRKGFYYDS